MNETPSAGPAQHTTEDRAPWPRNARFGAPGLEIAGIPAAALAAQYGTPLFVVDEDHFRSQCRAFGAAFPRVLYAIKAFPARALIRIAAQEGLGLLVASGGELIACLRAGVDPSKIAFHGNNKSDAELELAVSSGIGLLVCDNGHEVERLDSIARQHGSRQAVLVRVSPGVIAGTHSAIETGALDSKFGTPIEGGMALELIARACRAPGLRFLGLHAHVGSQILRPDPYHETIEALLDLVAEARNTHNATIETLDIGGGFGVTYTDEALTEIGVLSAALLRRIREGSAIRGLSMAEIIVEPGRALVANAVLTLYEVGSVKTIPGVRTYVAVDGGMSDNIRPPLYGARYSVAPAGPPPGGPDTIVTVVGKHCESGDVVAEDVRLPASISPGDLLGVAATGAYCYSMASNYNRVGRPAVVAVKDGRSSPWLRRETDDDLDRLEVEP